ncbi:hypothetical protein [Streptomyces fradiae]|uniref:hypothetical protein n=1 Tax=Streptomyces fradiae TaxID=1906 RepID=UPI003700564E
MAHRSVMDDAVHLSPPGREPVPVEGCTTCTGLAARREADRRAGDLSAVSDRNVEIRRHPHQEAAR